MGVETKKGDVCYLIIEGFENDPENWQETMIIDGDAQWNTYGKGYWEYEIVGKANKCPEGCLKLKNIKTDFSQKEIKELLDAKTITVTKEELQTIIDDVYNGSIYSNSSYRLAYFLGWNPKAGT